MAAIAFLMIVLSRSIGVSPFCFLLGMGMAGRGASSTTAFDRARGQVRPSDFGRESVLVGAPEVDRDLLAQGGRPGRCRAVKGLAGSSVHIARLPRVSLVSLACCDIRPPALKAQLVVRHPLGSVYRYR